MQRHITRRAFLALVGASPALLSSCNREPRGGDAPESDGDDRIVSDEGGMTVDENATRPTYTPVLQVGDSRFSADFESSPTVDALLGLLPLTLEMRELNGNEKYCYLGEPLPAEPEAVGWIDAGDLMLFGDDCIVVFYESFETPYTYTRIGRVADADGLREALGPGDVTCELWVEWSE